MIRYATQDDFEWVYALYEKNKYSLGPCYTASLRKSIDTKQLLVNENKTGFCEFHLPKTAKHISIYEVCVADEHRRKGLGKEFIEFIKCNYNYPIQAICIPNTDAEYFWKSIAEYKGIKKSRKQKQLHVYFISNNQYYTKEELF